MTWQQIKQKINNWIKTNGNKEITGAQSNEILNNIVDAAEQNNAVFDNAITVTNPHGMAVLNKVYAAGSKIETFIKDIATAGVSYQAPTAALTIDQSLIEVGQSVDVKLTTTFNQNHGGAMQSIDYYIDSTKTSGSNLVHTLTGVKKNTPGTLSFKTTVHYAAGATLPNGIGSPIGAGTVDSNTATVEVAYKLFYQASVALPSDGSAIRALTGNVLLNATKKEIEIPIAAGATNFVFALPPGAVLSKVEFIQLINLNQTSEFTASLTTIAGTDGGTGNIDYKRYHATFSALNAAATYKITLQ